ncbi:tRNA (adenosine(37)-N6)-threonylcarbamoyltransferase complex ATPase subunit type 1 TsaE [Sporosarcina pasteurii]|uniref:tRNA threonylcarbamoyladenosine biosynthesis protein TsaE n=1 Tax=Sporosarcina pasteurii TaxID=1474 RepID=A0A380CF70_SPOPA|nr:tRNA (adenosine(37)-N6)-threonylcarbamoyltransferase complex ATPase subunit type 1 TsaE [Sporosarcina pasteurii]MDS9473166.1 tRNA (adenosine(37)-N6)-threonylcarbamoyltransferase complex ATPase subunit type 1 TsaE [Sporosarcina pasteurii]QBQ06901.1 tRNA (adenosine(37)-N6)-threonylcarbamoyltransferase complex ATPase subunit type 1 TsaE [Sporosarcina pasteurii]SUJ19677.1 ADP-binding protein [Sporosarcina pasteurii]
MKKEIKVHSLAETKMFASKLAPLLTPPDVITLEGDLGAGKTAFTQALAKALGIQRTVSSPTFTIMKQYEGNYPFNHLDVYRLAGSDEDLGWDEIFYGDAITVVEWAHLIEEDLPAERLEIRITRDGENRRTITLLPKGKRYEKLCGELQI